MGVPTAALLLRKGGIDTFYGLVAVTILVSDIRANRLTRNVHASLFSSRVAAFEVGSRDTATAYEHMP